MSGTITLTVEAYERLLNDRDEARKKAESCVKSGLTVNDSLRRELTAALPYLDCRCAGKQERREGGCYGECRAYQLAALLLGELEAK